MREESNHIRSGDLYDSSWTAHPNAILLHINSTSKLFIFFFLCFKYMTYCISCVV
jgi:hypothetical protein